MSKRAWAGWIGATLVVAMGVHLATLHELPRRIMARTLARMGPPNAMYFGKRPDATSSRVVRPSPDLLYAACPFDLSKGSLRVTAPVPHSTYWSVSAYDAATNNFFVRNDMQIRGNAIEIIALRRGMKLPSPGNAPEHVILFAPTTTGLFLVRLLINDEANLAALDAIRHQASCETVASH
jgi:uncharacterized membrane protein